VPEQDVLRLETAERLSRREEAEQWVHTERLVARPEVAEAPERIRADENPLVSEPDRDLAPEPTLDDRHDDERGAGDVRERRLMVRDAEASGNPDAVPSVAVEELNDGGGLTE
jgi:hypothetical protein